MARAPVPSVAQFRALSAKSEAFLDNAQTNATIAEMLAVWTDKVASYAGKHTRRTIVAWDGSFVLAIVDCATFDLFTNRGFVKAQGADMAIVERYNKAMEWLREVARGEVEPFIDDGAGYDDDAVLGSTSEKSDAWTEYGPGCRCV